MSQDRWEDKGMTWTDWVIGVGSLGLGALTQPRTHIVEDTETGEERRLHVNPFQEVGDAIANGQWEDEAEDEFEEDDEDDDEDCD